ncbi:hypothetical protein PVK73_28945 [Bacillus thuringiensis]
MKIFTKVLVLPLSLSIFSSGAFTSAAQADTKQSISSYTDVFPNVENMPLASSEVSNTIMDHISNTTQYKQIVDELQEYNGEFDTSKQLVTIDNNRAVITLPIKNMDTNLKGVIYLFDIDNNKILTEVKQYHYSLDSDKTQIKYIINNEEKLNITINESGEALEYNGTKFETPLNADEFKETLRIREKRDVSWPAAFMAGSAGLMVAASCTLVAPEFAPVCVIAGVASAEVFYKSIT